MRLKKIICIILAIAVITPLVYMFSVNYQFPLKENNLSDKQRAVIMENFTPLSFGNKQPTKRIIDNSHPLNLLNYYGDEPIVDLWSSIPENQKPYTILLIIPGHTLLSGNDSALEMLESSADICEENKIPYAIQIINGEIAFEERIPVAYAENRFAKKHDYFYGLNAAELYNSVGWRGETESNNSQYIIDCINLCAKYGAFFLWTDTNIGYDNGMLLEWFETNEAFYSAFKENSEYICLMNKESFGDPSSYSVMQGLWLAGLVGNWGVASDWWHWTCDGDKKSLFSEYDELVDDEWDAIMNYPENMYVQSMMLVMSCGGTCFKAEAPNFSTSIGGTPVGGFEYGISPLLDKVIDGDLTIPTRQQVLDETHIAVLGKSDYDTFNYNMEESNLYPATGDFRIIPLLPDNLRCEEIDVFNDNNIILLNEKATYEFFTQYYSSTDNDTYLTRAANEWFYINNSENKRISKSAEFEPVLCSAEKFEIEAQEHSSAIISESKDGMYIYLSNYRTDKTEMIRKVTPAYMEGRKWADVCSEFLPIDDNGDPIGVDDTKKRTTTIKIKLPSDSTEPEISFRNSADGTGYQNRPYSVEKKWDEQSKELTIIINHNGVVELDVALDNSEKNIATVKNEISKTSVVKTGCSTTALEQVIESTCYTGDPADCNYYSYLKYNAAREKAKIIISEGTYNEEEIAQSAEELKDAYDNLLDISKYTAVLKEYQNKLNDSNSDEFDSLLRECVSVQTYVSGRANQLNYKNFYKNKSFNKSKKQSALDKKMKFFQ